MTARSGRHALRHHLEKLGYKLSQEELDKAYERFLEVADKKKDVYDEDLRAIVGDELRDVPQKYQLEYLHAISGTGTVPSATVRICLDGDKKVQQSAWGDGPVDASYEAIRKATREKAQVAEYAIRAVTHSSKAQGEVTVLVKDGAAEAKGRGVSTDVVEASAKAYIDALNRLAARQGERRTQGGV